MCPSGFFDIVQFFKALFFPLLTYPQVSLKRLHVQGGIFWRELIGLASDREGDWATGISAPVGSFRMSSPTLKLQMTMQRAGEAKALPAVSV